MASPVLRRTTPRALAGAVLLAVLLLAASTLSPPPASADITYLCTGYQGCREAGMKNGGYAKNRSTMYWRMYAGHNCTNYVAYRLVKRGMPNSRPWEGSGNASNWGYAMDHITDATPMVGSVAWWRANAPGAGSSGHVAYVQRVEAPGVIVVSQDNWGGDFKWSRISKSGRGWPTGFIHFRDVPLRNTVAPSVEGQPRVGETLTADGGAWRPRDPQLAYQWRRNGRAVVGATAATYVVRDGDLGARLSVRVTASKLGYPTTRVRSAAVEVVPGELSATSAPTVTGSPQVGSPLTAEPVTWNMRPDTQALQWLVAGKPVPGATDPTFVPGPDHADKRVKVQVTATRAGYEPRTVVSSATAPVATGTLSASHAPTISGEPRVGSLLTAEPVSWNVPPDAQALQWLVAGKPVPGATDPTFVPGPDHADKRVKVQVTATRAGYEPRTVVSGATAPVATGTFEQVRAPALAGAARPGVELRLDPGEVSPAAPPEVRWLRDGTAVPGASGPTYPLTVDDLGARLSAVLTRTGPGFEPLTTRTAATRVVKSPATLRLRTTTRRAGRVRMVARVSAPDVTPVTGRVRFSAGRRFVVAADLVDGRAVVRIDGVPSGPRKVRARFPGSDIVTRARVVREVVVR